ncbi:MAG: IS110 family transposase [bacterium]
MIGVDLAKSVFQVHAASMTGQVKFLKKLTRLQFERFVRNQAPAVFVMEACASAHYWARVLVGLGHEVKLIAPQYVKPFVKRQKNDAADAEALVIAAQRPEMRFVEPKSEAAQARAMLFRSRDRLVRQRAELVNALRGHLYEFGYSVPIGIVQLKRLVAIVEVAGNSLPELIRTESAEILAQISEKTARIEAAMQKIKCVAAETDVSRRLQTMPGVGPLTAMAVETFAPQMSSFRRARDFAAWLGLVPKQNSSGGKEKLGRISKAGQVDIRRLLVIGAMSRLNWLGRRTVVEGSWLHRMLLRKPRMLVAIALANKMARSIWAMLTNKEDYRDPAQMMAA